MQRLLSIIDQSTRLSFQTFQRYGETDASLTDLEQLDNVQARADLYYSRFYTLLKRIAEAQPIAPVAMLELLGNAIEEARTSPLHQYRLQKAGKVLEAKVQS